MQSHTYLIILLVAAALRLLGGDSAALACKGLGLVAVINGMAACLAPEESFYVLMAERSLQIAWVARVR